MGVRKELVFIVETSKYRRMLFAAVAHLVEGLGLEALFTLEVPNLLYACTGTSSIHNRMTVDFVHENIFQK